METPYPLLKEWHKIISDGCLRRKRADGDEQNVLDYNSLLEMSIPGSFFAFTDDQEGKCHINDNFWNISTSVVQLYENTKGRKRKELDNRRTKFSVLEGQTKSHEEYGKDFNQLKCTVEEWRSKVQ